MASKRSTLKEQVDIDIQNREHLDANKFKGKKKYVNEAMKQHNFRMKQSQWEILIHHFESKGLTVAQGIRMVLSEYARKNGLF